MLGEGTMASIVLPARRLVAGNPLMSFAVGRIEDGDLMAPQQGWEGANLELRQ